MRKIFIKISRVSLLLTFTLILLIILSNISFAESSSQAVFNRFTESQIKTLYSRINNYDPIIEQYAKKFNVPKNFIKAIIGVETSGINSPVYNLDNEIGIMKIVPFNASGGDLNYKACLYSKCMKVKLEPEDDTLEKKKARVQQEYGTVKNSICCGTYLLKTKYDKSNKEYDTQTLASGGTACSLTRPKIYYTQWAQAARKYNGWGCPSNNDHAFYVERVMQLKNAFDQLSGFDDSSLGTLSFTPSFRIKSPQILDIFDKLKPLLKDIQNVCSSSTIAYGTSQDCINQKLEAFETANNVEFNQYCEKPEVNFINRFYDNFANAIEFNQSQCRYPILNEFAFSGHDKPHILNFDLYGQPGEGVLVMKNNFTNDLFREYKINVPNNFFTGFNKMIVKKGADMFFKFKIPSFITNSPALDDIQKIYYIKDYETTGQSYFILHKNWIGENLYYDTFGNLIPNFNETKYPICNSSLPNYKLKYFTCLDTKKKENIYNWISGDWEESPDNIIIKFAFALKRT